MFLLIDNHDSFTYNVYQQMARLGADVDIKTPEETTIAAAGSYDAIVISPGPQAPEQAPVVCEIIRKYYRIKPMLGICLGHQCIASIFGSRTVRASSAIHGKTSAVVHNGEGIFQDVESPLIAARYHSLVIEKLPDGFEKSAWTQDGVIMGIRHQQYPLFGIQFHPESFLTVGGDRILSNFIHEHY
ncbi:aminodeoxychorismate/anthranilate synthase component II [Candidatus Uhrbacteria bacterium]|nr:aminodeoxychorismate/anthranilate synthase component II [Candidatus Uhrbacteria bacterium]